MVRPSSVVVLVVHLIAIPTVERERDPPVSIDVHGPLALPPTLERMKAESGGVEVADAPGGFEPCQNSTDLRNVVRVQAPEVAGLEEPLQPTMPEADDHSRTVPCNVSPVNTSTCGSASRGRWRPARCGSRPPGDDRLRPRALRAGGGPPEQRRHGARPARREDRGGLVALAPSYRVPEVQRLGYLWIFSASTTSRRISRLGWRVDGFGGFGCRRASRAAGRSRIGGGGWLAIRRWRPSCDPARRRHGLAVQGAPGQRRGRASSVVISLGAVRLG